MKSFKRAFLLGLLAWLVPFVVAMFVFPFRESWRALFESVMAAAVAATAVGCGWLYLTRIDGVQAGDGLKAGVLWWVMCVAIDLPLVSAGPMQMSLVDYLADIGLTYVSIPVIATALAAALGHRSSMD